MNGETEIQLASAADHEYKASSQLVGGPGTMLAGNGELVARASLHRRSKAVGLDQLHELACSIDRITHEGHQSV